MKLTLKLGVAVLVFSALTTVSLVAQDDGMAKIVGTWLLNLEKTAEQIDDEAQVEMMRTQMADVEMRMIFGEDGSMKMMRDEEARPGDMTFELTAQEDSKTVFDIEISGGPTEMRGKVEFMKDGSLKIQPAGRPGMILDREVEVITLEKAKEFFAGTWKINVEETTKLAEAAGGEVPADFPEISMVLTADEIVIGEGEGEKLKSGYNIEAGDEENTFVIALTSEEDGGIRIKAKIAGKNRAHMAPEGKDQVAVLDRANE